MSDVWNSLNLPCPVCQVARRPGDTQCRRCGQAFEAAPPSASRSLSRAPTATTLVLRQLSPRAADGQTWEVSDAPADVGRDRGTIMLRDKSVSRQHARITPDGRGGFSVQDLNSTNGTRVNDQRVVGLSPVRHGDQIAFGDVRVLAEVRPPAVAAAAPVAAPVPPVGITILYDQAPVVARAAAISQPAIDPTLHDEPAAPVHVQTPAASPPPLGSSFGREVLELAQAAEAIAARLRALEAAWRGAQTGGRS